MAKLIITSKSKPLWPVIDAHIKTWNKVIKAISQVDRIGKRCDQNGDRVSKSDKNYYNGMIRLKSLLVKYEKYGILSMQHTGNSTLLK